MAVQVRGDDSVSGWLARLESSDKLAPEIMVAEAADPDHVAHGEFTWDDSVAAHAHRLWQARQLVARFTVTVARSGDQRLYTNLRSEGRYVRTDRALDHVDWRAEMIEDAKAAARHFSRKYKVLGDDVLMALMREVIEGSG